MATIKICTDITRSKVLTKILSLESADMYWHSNLNSSDRQYLLDMGEIEYFDIEMNFEHYSIGNYDIPAWSLATLINIVSTYCNRLEITLRTNKKYNVFAVKGDFVFRSFDEFPDGIDNLIDCCYDIIIRLHKLNLL